MLPSSLREAAYKAVEWVSIIALFIMAPTVIVFVLRQILETVAGKASNAAGDFTEDSAMILLSFWFGSLGAFVSYTFSRAALKNEPDALGMKITKLVLGGSVAVAVFFFLKSGVLVKFLYPRAPITPEMLMTSYHGVIIVCIITGLVSPTIVERMQNLARSKLSERQRRADGGKQHEYSQHARASDKGTTHAPPRETAAGTSMPDAKV